MALPKFSRMGTPELLSPTRSPTSECVEAKSAGNPKQVPSAVPLSAHLLAPGQRGAGHREIWGAKPSPSHHYKWVLIINYLQVVGLWHWVAHMIGFYESFSKTWQKNKN
jgi:hypothetical protein